MQISSFFSFMFRSQKNVNNLVMKKIFAFILLLVAVCFMISICYTSGKNTMTNADFLRIHIRANSNQTIDQEIKYKIKDLTVDFLTPEIANCKNKQDVVDVITQKKTELQNLIDGFLTENNFDYKSNIKINNEYFPTRSYQNVVLESGFYDAMIIELGTATGNNWWCVLYPPLCFVNYSAQNNEGVVYKSRILEIIKSFFER